MFAKAWNWVKNLFKTEEAKALEAYHAAQKRVQELHDNLYTLYQRAEALDLKVVQVGLTLSKSAQEELGKELQRVKGIIANVEGMIEREYDIMKGLTKWFSKPSP